MNILYTAFNGKGNSSKILLDNIKVASENKLYLKNSFITSVKQLEKKIISNKYDLIVSFGQCPLEIDTIKIETIAKGVSTNLKTKYNFKDLEQNLKLEGFNTIISDDAGTYYCNNIYFYGLEMIDKYKLKTKMIFIHIPMLENLDIEKLSQIFK